MALLPPPHHDKKSGTITLLSSKMMKETPCHICILLFFLSVYASALREGIYSTIRLGLYEPFKEFFGEKDRSKTPLYKKIMSGALSGSIGSAIANPTDLVKIRLQAEGKLEPGMIFLSFLIWTYFEYSFF